MKLELETMGFDREDTGNWFAEFTVRGEQNQEMLRFSESVFAGKNGNETQRYQDFPAKEAMEKLFAKAKDRLRKAAESI